MFQPLVLVAYDISSPLRARRVRQSLRAYAVGGQKSLYECRLDAGCLQATLQQLDAHIDPQADRALIVQIGRDTLVRTLGVACAPHDGTCFYQG
ncbi:CRISPR-associated endonuclease Cas2 [Metallibacterium scheffleri]|uniref:CRISPR-associated endoribonuclease Cas2 n=1 Tax=Metallibacterium scheffleri TaxID=993689 RepID=A0A4S3KNZ6_9GAMM|nr:CRISPR-associated endonuclease Cas2 [Metallibacterium scheffleri]THD10692.1 CRISPR-associated endonuclease Cas2 [Metallibacterium scheffleri]